MVLAVGCAPTAPTAPPSSAEITPSPTIDPSAGAIGIPPSGPVPAATYDPETVLLVRDSAATVIVDRLPLFVDPSPSSRTLGVLVRGEIALLMLFEPIEIDGALWQYAMQITTPNPGVMPDLPTLLPEQEFALQGWVAARDGAAETLAKLTPRCPETIDFANVAAMFPAEQLACFGAKPLTLDGSYGCTGCSGDDLTYQPEWLAGQSGGRLRDVSGQDRGRVLLRFPPSVEPPDENTSIRVTGHFDDARAETCLITVSGKTVDHVVAVQLCRQRFVVDSWEPLSSEYIPPPD